MVQALVRWVQVVVLSEEYPDDWKPLADRHSTGWRETAGKISFDRSEYVTWARKMKRRQKIFDALFALFLVSLGGGVLYWIFG